MPTCPLCLSAKTEYYIELRNRNYSRCTVCDLIFMHKQDFVSPQQEKERYELHQNHLLDAGYKSFLNQIIQPVKQRVPSGKNGLDYGSGPFPALTKLLESAAYCMDRYDVFFHPDGKIFNKKYDFIVLSEVAEHFYAPAKEFQRLIRLLKSQAYLFVMTHRTDTVKDFAGWYYPKDVTHVCFYAQKSMRYIAGTHNLNLEIINDRLVVFQKK